MSKKVQRLFAGFMPKHYQVHLEPDKETLKFAGSVIIDGQKAGRPSKRLTFHQNGLKISKAKITKHDKNGQQNVAVARINHHRKLDEVRLHAEQMLYPGRYTVEMEFAGTISRNMSGIYPCFFRHDGKDKRLLTTQFESHYARESFPCIDEPEAKATFELSLVTPAEETVLSNTPAKKESKVKDSPALKEVTFETTPVMSTYLLAFAFGELGFKEAKTERGTLVRTYATPDNVAYTEFALETAVRCLEFYEDYFGIDYPLQKCDLIALPDFEAGAMENWGLITFREQAMLVDPDNTSLPGKQRVAEVVAHELTHQWFGNLVTMQWWTDLWLNEGFATWMAYLAMDKLFPEWKIWTQFIASEQQYALKLDALANTHPIKASINHPDEIRTIFDAISYEKGASCIHMLSQYLGDEMFRQGLSSYLQNHAYGNTVTDDLWSTLEQTSGKPVKDFMNTWTSQPGYPLLRAHVEKDKVHLAQERFLLNPADRERCDNDQPIELWPLPLNAGKSLPDTLKSEETTVDVAEQSTLILINQDHSSFYRTVYNTSHLERLGEEIERGQLSVLDRVGLLADTFEAAKAGFIDTAVALTLLESYKSETNESVWDIIAGNISAIRTVMNDDQLREDLKPYTRELVAAELSRLGWDAKPDESHFDTLLRPTILGMASVADHPDVIDEAKKRFANVKKMNIAPDIRSVVYTTVARKGNADTFNKLLDMHDQSQSSEERNKLAAALTNFEQPELIKRSLELITSDSVRLQDAVYWIVYSFMNRFGRKQTWDWMVENWAWLQENMGTDLSFYRMPIYSARVMSDPNFLARYKKFFETVKTPALERSIKQGIEIIEWQSTWRTRDLVAVKTFLKSRK